MSHFSRVSHVAKLPLLNCLLLGSLRTWGNERISEKYAIQFVCATILHDHVPAKQSYEGPFLYHENEKLKTPSLYHFRQIIYTSHPKNTNLFLY